LFPKQAALADAWWKHLRGKSPSETLNLLRQLLENKMRPDAFTALAEEADRAAPKLWGDDYPHWLRLLAETCQVLGRDDLARKYLAKRVEIRRSADAHLQFAKFLFGKAQW